MKVCFTKIHMLLLGLLLVGCAGTPMEVIATQPPVSTTLAPEHSTSIPTIPTDPVVQVADLSGFTSAWSSHDDGDIRDFYTEDARYFNTDNITQLSLQQPIQVQVSEDAFEGAVERFQGLKMRILGSPILIFDKLVAFSYRWENGTSGYNGMSLLRYEEDKILLQVDLTSDRLTSNDSEEIMPVVDTSHLDTLMKIWNTADLETARTLYAENARILSDEDLTQAPWRDHSFPAGIDDLLPQFSGWNPSIISQPMQLEDKVIFAWRWYDKEYPTGYGIRLLEFDGGVIVSDIRFVIRPWEAVGKAFMTP